MQMTFEQTMQPGLLQAFSARRGSGYMMRSEKRSGAYGSPNRRPPRRKKAGGVYIFFTILISIILWPVGMVMLWRRKVRLQAGTKLLVSLLTLCLSVFLIVFALTVPVDNPQFTAFQDKANDWLDTAAVNAAKAGDAAIRKSSETWNVIADFTDAEREYAAVHSAEALDKGVALAAQARDAIEGLFHRAPAAPAPTQAPVDTVIPATKRPATETPADTEAPATETPATEVPADTETPAETGIPATEAPEDAGPTLNVFLPVASPDIQNARPLEPDAPHSNGGSAEPDPTEAVTEAPTEEATEAPAATPAEEATEAPAATPVEEATEVPTLAVTVLPTEAAVEETPAPEVDEGPYRVKPAGEATVYFYASGSKGFHSGPTRHEMEGAPAHTLAEAFAAGKNPCASCGMPDESVLTIEHIAWVDEDNRIHTTDACDSFAGQWRLMSLGEALDAGYAPCADCGADLYAEDIYPAPTPTPEPETVRPATALKSAGEITVYYFEASKGYHAASECVGMNNAPAHTLAEALADGKHACGNCGPVSTDLIGLPMLWVDADGVCHTSDECAGFKGKYRLVLRDDALAQGLAACPDCGAAEYLIPGTVLAED